MPGGTLRTVAAVAGGPTRGQEPQLSPRSLASPEPESEFRLGPRLSSLICRKAAESAPPCQGAGSAARGSPGRAGSLPCELRLVARPTVAHTGGYLPFPGWSGQTRTLSRLPIWMAVRVGFADQCQGCRLPMASGGPNGESGSSYCRCHRVAQLWPDSWPLLSSVAPAS
jgi:hypothetical protein